jgi:alanine dehydrogenase
MTGTAGAAARESPVLLLTRHDVRRLLTIDECTMAVEQAFRLHGEGAAQTPLVLATHVTGGAFHIKAGVLPFAGGLFYAAKTNANFPENHAKHGLPTIQGVLLLFNAECGAPLAIMDSIEITSLRTAAATAVAARYLARAASSVVTVIGCGVQGESQVAALLATLPIRTIYAYDTDTSRSEALAARFAGKADRVQRVNDFADGTVKSDIIVTCTTSRTAFLMPSHVRPGTFIAAVGADNEDKQELNPQLLAANRVIPDIIGQAASIGELHHALAARLLTIDNIAADLGQVVAGKRPGRVSDNEITIFDSTGMALQDVAAACAVYQKARDDDRISDLGLSK